ncbi:MAG: LamG domain-containing protein [Phycisphaerales bacterium]
MARNLRNLILLVVLANSVFAATSVTNKWTGTDSNSWGLSTNWDLGRIPNFVKDGTYNGDYVWINYIPTRLEGCVINGGDHEAYNINVMREGIDNSSVRAILNLKSGSLTVKGWEFKLGMGTYGYYVAHPAQPYSVVNMYEGFTLNITGTGGLTVGDYYDGEFNMYGGVYNHNAGGFRIGNSAYNGGLGYGKGIFNLYGGRININVWNSGTNRADIRDFTPESEINIGDGNMALVGNNISFLQNSINNGFIKAISPRNLIMEFDENAGTMGTTYIRAEIPTKAYNPTPANMAIEVGHAGTILNWQPAIGAVRHKVYLGLSESALELIGEIDSPSTSLSLPLLDYGKQYFWRVDEVNSGGSVIQGYIWKFTVSDGIVIDLFEDYNDTYTVDNKWSSLGGGSISLETDAAFDNVYQGDKSLKLNYYNSNSYSEAVYTYSGTSDWDAYDIKSLSIAVHGKATNGKDFLYAVVEDSAGILSNPVIYSNDPCSIVQTMYSPWIIFNIDIADFGTSVNISQIKKLHIGIGNRTNPNTNSSGTVHFDYIKLYPSRCLKDAAGADLNGDCFVNLTDFAEFASQWLTDASPVQPHKEPILRYDFEDNSDAYTAIDTAGVFDGTIVGEGYGYYDTKEDRKAYFFLGLYGDAGISIPSGAFAGFDNQITVSFWAYGDPDQLLRHTYAFKFAFAGGNTLFGTLPSSGGYIYDLSGLSSDNVIYHPISESAYSGSWAHWAFVRDFGSGEISVYRNGIKVASKYNASVQNSVFSSVSYAWVGARELVGDVTKPDTSYCGWIDDFEIYDYVLSEKEIIYLANQTFDADSKADFDDNNEIDFKDLSKLVNDWLEQVLWP